LFEQATKAFKIRYNNNHRGVSPTEVDEAAEAVIRNGAANAPAPVQAPVLTAAQTMMAEARAINAAAAVILNAATLAQTNATQMTLKAAADTQMVALAPADSWMCPICSEQMAQNGRECGHMSECDACRTAMAQSTQPNRCPICRMGGVYLRKMFSP
jgi:hypothetical protein